MNILFTICGRAGSKGVRGKNTRDFLGVPLVRYTVAAVDLFTGSHPEHRCLVALNTDSDDLKRLVGECGIPFLEAARAESLAGDRVSKVAVIADTWRTAEAAARERFDAVVDLDITSPLRTLSDVERVVERRDASDADTVFTVTKSRRNPCFNMVKKVGENRYGRILDSDFNTRQEAPEYFDMNASIYAYSPAFLSSGKQIFEGTCDIVEMADTAVLDIDSPDDLALMEVIARYLFETREEYAAIAARAKAYSGGQPSPKSRFNQADIYCNGYLSTQVGKSYIENQLVLFGGAEVGEYLPEAVKRSLRCFKSINNKYYREDAINVSHTGQYATLLLWLARVAFEAGDHGTASKVYALNKALHGFDVFYEVELPDVFFMEHPVGTVLGRAKYSDRIFVGQNVTVGGNKGSYPEIGENVALHTGCIIVGNTVIGNNVEVSAGAFVRGEVIPDNCLVFGESPNLVVKQRDEAEMLERLYYFM